jgi:chromosome partitioning protein
MLTGKEQFDKTVFDLFLDREGKEVVADIVQPALDGWPNTYVIPGSGKMANVDSHLGHRPGKERILRKMLQPIKANIDLVLIDLGPAADFLTLNALVAADLYHVPTDLSEYTLTGLITTQELANEVRVSGANPDLKFAGIHLSGFHKGGSYGVRGLEKKLNDLVGTDRIDIRVPHSSKVIESQGQHKPVGLIDPEGKVSQAYKLLIERFL